MQVYLHLKHFDHLLPTFNRMLQCFLLIPREGKYGYVSRCWQTPTCLQLLTSASVINTARTFGTYLQSLFVEQLRPHQQMTAVHVRSVRQSSAVGHRFVYIMMLTHVHSSYLSSISRLPVYYQIYKRAAEGTAGIESEIAVPAQSHFPPPPLDAPPPPPGPDGDQDAPIVQEDAAVVTGGPPPPPPPPPPGGGAGGPPPPPPPPGSGGGPPPPPGMPGMKAAVPSKPVLKPSTKMKGLMWQKINVREIDNTIWKKVNDEKLYSDLDREHLEQLFGQNFVPKSSMNDDEESNEPAKPKLVSLIDGRRAQNICTHQ